MSFPWFRKRLKKDPLLAQKYKKTVNQYIKKNHVTKLENDTANRTSDITKHKIPHQAVTKPTSQGI